MDKLKEVSCLSTLGYRGNEQDAMISWIERCDTSDIEQSIASWPASRKFGHLLTQIEN